MYAPRVDSEVDGLLGYLNVQFDGIRNAAHGLTDEQARLTPCRSALSIGGIVKHAAFTCRGAVERVRGGADTSATPTKEEADAFLGSFALTEDETLDGVLAEFDAAREAYLALVKESDPDGRRLQPPAFWVGEREAHEIANRFWMVHHVEEFARHAGHADIIREQLDGATAGALYLAVNNLPGTQWMRPWRPADQAAEPATDEG